MAELDDLVGRIHAGDARAFAELVTATTPRLFRLAARLMANTEEAEDVLQDAYVRAYDALAKGRFDGRAAVESWLYRVVTNAAVDALRAKKRRPNAAVAADEESLGAGSDEAARLEARSALRALDILLQELPPEQRTALVLKEVEGLSSAEIGEALGCTEGAVEQRLVRARATLRQRRGS